MHPASHTLYSKLQRFQMFCHFNHPQRESELEKKHQPKGKSFKIAYILHIFLCYPHFKTQRSDRLWEMMGVLLQSLPFYWDVDRPQHLKVTLMAIKF